MRTQKTVIDVCAALLLLLFLYTAWNKVLDHEKFLFQLRLSPFLLMRFWSVFLVWLVPLAEMLIAVFLILPHWRRRGLILSVILLGVFEVYIGFMLLSGVHLPCSCGGVFARMSWQGHLFFNAVFMLLGLLGLRAYRGMWPFKARINNTEYLSRPEARIEYNQPNYKP